MLSKLGPRPKDSGRGRRVVPDPDTKTRDNISEMQHATHGLSMPISNPHAGPLRDLQWCWQFLFLTGTDIVPLGYCRWSAAKKHGIKGPPSVTKPYSVEPLSCSTFEYPIFFNIVQGGNLPINGGRACRLLTKFSGKVAYIARTAYRFIIGARILESPPENEASKRYVNRYLWHSFHNFLGPPWK